MPGDARRNTLAGGPARWSMLSGRQKRELAQMMGVGLLSAVVFAGSAFMGRPHAPLGPSPSAVRPQAGRANDGLASRSVEVRHVEVQVRQVEVQPAVLAPALAPTGIVVRRGLRQGAGRGLAPIPQRPPLGRRLARLFAGDGRYTVQPFPMVPATHR